MGRRHPLAAVPWSSISSAVATALIAVASAIGGGLVVARSNFRISRAQSESARLGDLRQTLSALLSALGQVETELRGEPRTKRTVRFVNEQMASRFPQLDYVTGRLHRRIFHPHLDGLVVHFHDAMAAVLLVAPPELLPPIGAVADIMAIVDPQSDEWWASWQSARANLAAASRRALGREVPTSQDDS